MDRRSYLRATGVAGASGLAGCLDDVTGLVGSAGNENAVLGPPDQEKGGTVPTYGDEFPTFTLPDPLRETEVSTADFEGERAFLLTFFYTNCPDEVCPALLSRLVHAQERAAEAGFSDEIALLAMTFDPPRDTAPALREEGERQGADVDADNWHFLRPESREAADTLLAETIGLDHDLEDLGGHEGHGNESAGHQDGNESDQLAAFSHYALMLLVNRDGYVERSYQPALNYEWETITDDLETVVEG